MKKLLLALSLAAAFISGTLMIPQYVSADHQADFAAIINGLNTYGQYQSTIINGLVQVIIDTNAALQAQIDAMHQQCSVGKIVVGFDTSGNPICKSARLVSDRLFSEPTANVGTYTTIIDNVGLPAILYFDETNQDLKGIFCGDPKCSSGNIKRTIDGAVQVGRFASGTGQCATVNVSPVFSWWGTASTPVTVCFPVVSYFDDSNDDLKLLVCGDASCGSTTITIVDSAGFVGAYSSVAVQFRGSLPFPPPFNLPIFGTTISYFDDTNNDLKLVWCDNLTCTGAKTFSTVDSAGSVGFFTSIAISNDGLPVISYFDDTNDDLKVAKCGNPTCNSGNTITSVDTTGFVGRWSSIVIPSDGLPVISYLDDTNADLKVAKCGNASCSSGNTITTVDSAGAVGLYTSIALNFYGLPVISYYDQTNGDLKMVECGNSACNSGNTISTLDSQGSVGSYSSISSGVNTMVSYYDETNGDLKVVVLEPTRFILS